MRKARLKPDAIDDLAQETAVRTLALLESAAADAGEAMSGPRFRGFLVRVAANAGHEIARARRRERRLMRSIDQVPPEALRARPVANAPLRERVGCLDGTEPWLSESDRLLVTRLLAGASLDAVAASRAQGRGGVRRRIVILLRAAESRNPAATLAAAERASAQRRRGAELAAQALRSARSPADPTTCAILELRTRGVATAEIAEVLGLSAVAVRKRLSRALCVASRADTADVLADRVDPLSGAVTSNGQGAR